MNSIQGPPVRVFISYAHEDRKMLVKLDKHLVSLIKSKSISIWYDKRINGGEEWEPAIEQHLNEAELILLLISPDFMNSKFCYDREMQRAIERHTEERIKVIPIFLQPVLYNDTPLKKLQFLPSGDKPIALWENKNEAYSIVAEGIKNVVDEILRRRTRILQPDIPDHSPSPEKKMPTRRKILLVTFAAVMVLCTTLGIGYAFLGPQYFNSCEATPIPTSTNGIGLVTPATGLSDGLFAFDIKRPDGKLKMQASQCLEAGNTSKAISNWEAAIKSEPYDAEALIYLEDQCVRQTHRPYITIVVGTILDRSYGPGGPGDLQGVYFAQHEYNSSAHLNCPDVPALPDNYQLPQPLPSNTLVRVLIANAENDANNASNVANQIVQLSKADRTFAGVVGWPTSLTMNGVLPVLRDTSIPAISPSASENTLAQLSPYFWHIAPLDQDEAMVDAQYAQQILSAKKVIILASNDPYSDLASSFEQDFNNLTHDTQDVSKEPYTKGSDVKAMDAALQAALNSQPAANLVFFVGNSRDAKTLFNTLTLKQHPELKVLGGDALYNLAGDYPLTSYGRLYMTAFASPHAWNWLGQKNPSFLDTYPRVFALAGQNCLSGESYGCSLASNHAILSYDAMTTLLRGSSSALKGARTQPLPVLLQTSLSQLPPFQGVSGQIHLSSDKNGPILVDKAILILNVDSAGKTQMQDKKCQFFLNDPSYSGKQSCYAL